MPEHEHGHHGPPDTSKGYEQSDLGLPGIIKGVVAYFIFTGAVGAFVLILMIAFHENNPNPSELAPTRLPPQPYPLLQNDVTAHTDIWNLRAREGYLLENTTYVDKSKGILRIPIEDAIDKAAAMGPKGEAQLPGISAANGIPPTKSYTTDSAKVVFYDASKPGASKAAAAQFDKMTSSDSAKTQGSGNKIRVWVDNVGSRAASGSTKSLESEFVAPSTVGGKK